MNQRAVAAVADAIVPIIAESLGEFLKPMLGRMTELEHQVRNLSSIEAEPAPRVDVDALVVAAADEAINKALPTIVADVVASIPKPKDGLDADVDEIRAEISRQVAALPPAEPGRDADSTEVIRAASSAVMELLPNMLQSTLADYSAALSDRCDGLEKRLAEIGDRDPTEGFKWDEFFKRANEAIQRAVDELPKPEPGKDGIGITDGLIDREGHLVVTFSDGRIKDLGQITDPNATRELLDRHIAAKFEALPKPKDGKDGFGFDDFEVDFDGDRTVTLRFIRGDDVKEKSIRFPVAIDRGVFSPEKPYERGDSVSYGGSMWIAQKDDPAGKPGDENSDWRLSVKRGRNGKDGGTIKPPPQGPVKSGQ